MNYEHYSERHTQAPPSSLLESMIREEMNLQISAARERPRSMRDFEARAIVLATMDEQTAGSCLSSLPVGRKQGRMEYAPAIGNLMAEIVGATYGNLRVNGLVVEETPRRVRARGFALDMEGNFGVSSDVVEVADAKDRPPRNEEAGAEIARAAVAKARRGAICMVAPKSVWKAVETACVRVAFGNPDAFARGTARIAAWMNGVGIREERVWRALGIAGERDLNVERAATLLGLRTAISDGDTTLDEAFPTDLAPPKFIPPETAVASPTPSGAGPRASAPCALAQLSRLAEACHIASEPILEYIRAKGLGTYKYISAAPDAVLHSVVRAWPDVVAEIAGACGE